MKVRIPMKEIILAVTAIVLAYSGCQANRDFRKNQEVLNEIEILDETITTDAYPWMDK